MRSVNSLLRARVAPRLSQATTHSQQTILQRAFSTQSHLFLQHKSQPGKTKDELGQNPSYPAFSFEALGVSKNMKIVLLGILSILGTIETWVWCKAIWYWWKGDSDVQKE